MTTPRKKPIDLSKCTVGQRVRLRSGEEVTFKGKSGDDSYPFHYLDTTGLEITVLKSGKAWLSEGEDELDIVAILSPAKKAKKAKKPAKKVASKLEIIWAESKKDKAAICRVIKLLKGLLKP